VFSVGSASDCPNLLTGRCQAGAECYALKDEVTYLRDERGDDRQASSIDSRRRSEVVFRGVSVEDLAHALGQAAETRAKYGNADKIRQLRINEAGDVRSKADIEKLDRIAGILSREYDIDAYLYSASSHVEWPAVENIVVNASNDAIPERVTDNRFKTVQSAPSNGFVCKMDCSECIACAAAGGDREIYVELH